MISARPSNEITTAKINVNEIPSGHYLLKIKTKQGTFVRKILVE